MQVVKSTIPEKTKVYKRIKDLPRDDFRRNPHKDRELPENLKDIANYQFDLCKRKGFLNYDEITSFASLDATSLPSEPWFNILTEERLTNMQYAHAKQIWDEFECKNLGEYCAHYLITDVLLLADVLINFQQTCHRDYKIDPIQFFTLPGYAYQCMLKMTKVELELLHDANMYNFIESGIRGGVSVICNRYAKANMRDASDYDPSKPETHILYLDANNLYGWAMVQSLPKSDFEWDTISDDLKNDVDRFVRLRANDDDEGCILMVDMKYDKKLHDVSQ